VIRDQIRYHDTTSKIQFCKYQKIQNKFVSVYEMCLHSLRYLEPNTKYTQRNKNDKLLYEVFLSFCDNIHVGFIFLFLCMYFEYGSENCREYKVNTHKFIGKCFWLLVISLFKKIKVHFKILKNYENKSGHC
jgi:hypothetical protein